MTYLVQNIYFVKFLFENLIVLIVVTPDTD